MARTVRLTFEVEGLEAVSITGEWDGESSLIPIAETILRTLIPARIEPGIWFLSPLGTEVWVQPDEPAELTGD
jgi:hypothetical protein